ncbi:MAG: transcription termination/antitermination protein NusA, partial [Clostridia bacterium]|nr:transcription termination/antitermination protein NusA [Clostridia bacterium]
MAKKAAQQPAETSEVILYLKQISNEKKIPEEILYSKIEAAMVSAYKKEFGKQDNVSASMDRVSGEISVFARKTIVEEVADPTVEISLAEVRERFPELAEYDLGDLVEVPAGVDRFGRIAVQTARMVILQGIREAERGHLLDELSDKENEVLTAIVKLVEADCAYVEVS